MLNGLLTSVSLIGALGAPIAIQPLDGLDQFRVAAAETCTETSTYACGGGFLGPIIGGGCSYTTTKTCTKDVISSSVTEGRPWIVCQHTIDVGCPEWPPRPVRGTQEVQQSTTWIVAPKLGCKEDPVDICWSPWPGPFSNPEL